MSKFHHHKFPLLRCAADLKRYPAYGRFEEDTCRQLEPKTFGETDDYSYVQEQPSNGAERGLHCERCCRVLPAQLDFCQVMMHGDRAHCVN